jgi:hypothetical protein
MTQEKKSATKAARELLLGDRLPVIERLAEAKGKLVTLQDREVEARSARRAGEDEVREQYDAALKKGWSSSELRSLGFAPPRKRRGSSPARPQNGHRPAPSSPPASIPAGGTTVGPADAATGGTSVAAD